MKEKAPRLGRCPADCAATGWALSALQAAARRSRITQRNQQAGQAGVGSSPPKTTSPSQPLPALEKSGSIAQGGSGSPRYGGQRWVPQKSELG